MPLNAGNIPAPQRANRVPQEEIGIGNYMSRLVQIIDTGIQYKDVWDPATNSYKKDTSSPPVQHIYTTYELLTEYMKDENGVELEDKPRWISEEWPLYSLEQDLATTTKRYNGIDPQHVHGGDWTQLGAAPCQVAVVHKKSGKAKIGGVAAAIKGIPYPELKNEPKVYTIDMGENEIFGSLPPFLQERIKSALNWGGQAVAPQPAQAAPQAAPEPVQAQAVGMDEDNPF